MACHLGSKIAKSEDDFVVCELCEEGAEARHHCDDCLASFCDRCAQSHGKHLAQKGVFHRVEAGACVYDLEVELCPVHEQKMAFYCLSCRVRVCAECEMDGKRHVMHIVMSLTRHVGLEKEKLLDKLDDVTTKTETLSHFPDDIKTMRTQIELKWLERKELMRQEFASLLDTLTTQQHKLLADLQEEVNKSLGSLQQLQQTHGAVLSDTCQLSDECISAVQNLPRDQFISSYPQFVDSLKAVENEMDGMESAQSHMPAFLQVPFSLHREKTHLHHCLQAPVFNVQSIRARDYQRFVPLERLKEEVTVTMLLDTPTPNELPPSSTLRYNVSIFCGSKQSKKPVWSSRRPLRAPDPVINGIHGHQLLPGNLYVVKIQPIVSCLSHQGVQSVEGRTISILIVTDSAGRGAFEPIMAAGDNHALADTCSLLNSAFEDNMEQGNLFCVNMAVESAAATGSSNNNNNNRTRLLLSLSLVDAPAFRIS